MERRTDIIGNLETALAAAEMGYVPIPVLPDSKVPAVKWKRWQDEMPPEWLIREWFADPRRNLAIITNGLVVFDCDDPAKADLVIEKCGDTPHKVRSPRGGVHLGFRRRKGLELGNAVKVKGMDIDIRTDGGLEMLPESRTEDGTYEWLGHGLIPREGLPVARIGWTRTKTKRKAVIAIEGVDGNLEFTELRAKRWLQFVEGAVSGQQGHAKTFRVACRLTHFPPRGFGLSFEQAMRLMLIWNEKCQPPWDDKALTHKLQDALKKR